MFDNVLTAVAELVLAVREFNKAMVGSGVGDNFWEMRCRVVEGKGTEELFRKREG